MITQCLVYKAYFGHVILVYRVFLKIMTHAHDCTVPGGGRYNYSVAYTTWQNGTGDVLSQFLESCNAKNIGTGFYYSLASNTFAQRMGWTADEVFRDPFVKEDSTRGIFILRVTVGC